MSDSYPEGQRCLLDFGWFGGGLRLWMGVCREGKHPEFAR